MAGDTEKKEKLLDEFEAKLNKIISEIERSKNSRIINIFTAVLLSFTTIGSAWCAFQSTLWSGDQTFALAAAGKAGRLSSEYLIRAIQKRTNDGVVLLQYINASEEGNEKMKDFYFSRFDSTLKNATMEWLKLDPMNNINAPNSPMKMQAYDLYEESEALVQLNLSAEKLEFANEANRISDRYVLLTVLFAGVLFFGGIASTLESKLVRNICLILSALIFISTFIVLFSMPVTSI